MCRYFLLCLILVTSHVYSQETIADKTITIWEGWHYSTPLSGGVYKVKKQKITEYYLLMLDLIPIVITIWVIIIKILGVS